MKQTVSEYQFIEGFNNRKENFSYEGLQAMFEYFNQLEDDLVGQIEFDPIAICCEYSEYENLIDFQSDYDVDDYPDMESIYDNTTVIPFGVESFIIQQF